MKSRARRSPSPGAWSLVSGVIVLFAFLAIFTLVGDASSPNAVAAAASIVAAAVLGAVQSLLLPPTVTVRAWVLATVVGAVAGICATLLWRWIDALASPLVELALFFGGLCIVQWVAVRRVAPPAHEHLVVALLAGPVVAAFIALGGGYFSLLTGILGWLLVSFFIGRALRNALSPANPDRAASWARTRR